MDNGGSVYMEGANVGQDHNNTEFYDHFGTVFDGVGGDDTISTLEGEEQTFSRNSVFGYPAGDCNYSIDLISGGLGTTFLSSQEGYGRGVYYDSGMWRTINVSPILGAYDQDEQFSTRKFMMMEYISFLAGFNGPELCLSENEIEFVSYSPGAAVTQSVIAYNTGNMDLEIWEINQSDDNCFLIESVVPITIADQECSEIFITFRGIEIGEFIDVLTIISNDLDHEEETLTLYGSCLMPPDIYVEQEQFDVVLGTNTQTILELMLYNYGGSSLQYDVWFDDQINWIDIPCPTGQVPVDDSNGVFININTTGMSDGYYTTELIVNSNDPDSSMIIVPVNLTVNNVENNPSVLPTVTGIQSVYPNPFNPQTSFNYSLAETSSVKLEIYNVRGQLVKELVNGEQSSGNYCVIWDACEPASGIYFYRFRAARENQKGKILLLK